MQTTILKDFIENNKAPWFSLTLFSKEKSLLFVEILHQSNIRIFGFDGFVILDEGKYQIDQNYSRDYSQFKKKDAYLLTKEYFLKSTENGVMYDISYQDKWEA